MGVDQQSWGEYLAGAEWRGEDLDKLNALPDEEKAKLVNQMKTQQEAADKVYQAQRAAEQQKELARQAAEKEQFEKSLAASSNQLGWSKDSFDSNGNVKPVTQASASQSTATTANGAQGNATTANSTNTNEKTKQTETKQTTKAEEKPAQQAQTTQAVQQVIPTQATQQVYQRPAEPPVKMGANGYPIYERLPNGGYRYDTTYLDPQGKVDPYAMPNGIRGDFGDQEAYWNLRNRATSAKARYEQSQAANLQGEATAGLMQVQADPETHRRAQEYMQSGMALNAQEALNLATAEQAQRMGIWGAAANAYAPAQQGLDNAQTRNSAAGMYYGADTPNMVSANGFRAHTGLNGVTFNNDGTVNVVAPNGQVINGVSADRAMAAVAGGSPQGAAAARINAATNVNRFLNGSYGGMWSGAPTNAAVYSLATTESNKAAKSKNPDKTTAAKSTYANE
jgi:hypothetical protein